MACPSLFNLALSVRLRLETEIPFHPGNEVNSVFGIIGICRLGINNLSHGMRKRSIFRTPRQP